MFLKNGLEVIYLTQPFLFFIFSERETGREGRREGKKKGDRKEGSKEGMEEGREGGRVKDTTEVLLQILGFIFEQLCY